MSVSDYGIFFGTPYTYARACDCRRECAAFARGWENTHTRGPEGIGSSISWFPTFSFLEKLRKEERERVREGGKTGRDESIDENKNTRMKNTRRGEWTVEKIQGRKVLRGRRGCRASPLSAFLSLAAADLQDDERCPEDKLGAGNTGKDGRERGRTS